MDSIHIPPGSTWCGGPYEISEKKMFLEKPLSLEFMEKIFRSSNKYAEKLREEI